MPPRLGYVIEYVENMDRAMKFYRDIVGLPVKFQSPGWSEFFTGETTLGLHPASATNPAGKVELGLNVANLQRFYEEMRAKGVEFPMPPAMQDFGGALAKFVDSEGGHVIVAEPTREDPGRQV